MVRGQQATEGEPNDRYGQGQSTRPRGPSDLGGLIDVRPKQLHAQANSQDPRTKTHTKGKDNVQTVLGTDKVMISSKPRGPDSAEMSQ